MAVPQQYCLKWNNYLHQLTGALDNHRAHDEFVDVTLLCEGRKITAHKVVLSSCSSYFKDIFSESPHPHPLLIFNFIKYEDLNSIIQFMYQGEVNVKQEGLDSFLQIAKLLSVHGLNTEGTDYDSIPSNIDNDSMPSNIVMSIPEPVRVLRSTSTDINRQQKIQTLLKVAHENQTQNNLSTSIDKTATHPTPSCTQSSYKKRKLTDNDNAVSAADDRDEQATVNADDIGSRDCMITNLPEYILGQNNDQPSAIDPLQEINQNLDYNCQNVANIKTEYETLVESDTEEKYTPTDDAEMTIETRRLTNPSAPHVKANLDLSASCSNAAATGTEGASSGGGEAKRKFKQYNMVDNQPITYSHKVSLSDYETIKSKIISGEFKIKNISGRSKVWDIYGNIEDSAGNEIKNLVACRKCFTINKTNRKRTTNLVKHKCVVTSGAVSDGPPKIDVEAETKKQGVIVFAEWIVQNCRSFLIVQDAGFMQVAEFFVSVGAKYGKNVDIQKLLPHPTTISRNIQSVYRPHFDQIKCEIDLIKNIGFGLTADIWTDNYLRKIYLAVTIHYILNGKLFCRLLGMRSMEREICTHDLIAMKVSNLLEEFNCEFNDKVIMVTDMGTNMFVAFRDKNRINCVNHLLYNTMQKSLQEVDEVAELCSISTKLVKYLKVSGQNSLLQSTLESFSPTRWNTKFYVFTSISNNWEEINKILQETNQLHRIYHIDINLLNEIIKVLQSFEETFKTLEGDTYPIIHTTFLYIYRLKDKCSVLPEDLLIIKKLKETLNNYLDSIVIENMSIYHKLAIFLFPPTNKLLNFNETEKNNIQQKCKDLMRNYLAEDPCNIVQNETRGLTTIEREILQSYGQHCQVITAEDQIRKEMQTYTNLNIYFLKDCEVIQWWESHKTELPLLYKVSCSVLAVPATSAASERTFSVAGCVLSEKRSAVGFNNTLTNEILFLHSNLNEKEIAINLKNVA